MSIVSGGTGKYVSKGVNDSNNFFVHFTITPGAAPADTVDCLIPDHTDKDAVPVAAVAYTRAITGVVSSRALTITSHQVAPDAGQTAAKTVGTTILTVGAVALPANSIIQVEYSAVKFPLEADYG